MTLRRALWLTLAAAAMVELVGNALGGRSDPAWLRWWHAGLLAAPAMVVLVRAARRPEGRAGWAAIGAGLTSWAAGNAISASQGSAAWAAGPADVLWLAWYPLVVLGISLWRASGSRASRCTAGSTASPPCCWWRSHGSGWCSSQPPSTRRSAA